VFGPDLLHARGQTSDQGYHHDDVNEFAPRCNRRLEYRLYRTKRRSRYYPSDDQHADNARDQRIAPKRHCDDNKDDEYRINPVRRSQLRHTRFRSSR
jgi:hypothetical protein